MKFYIDFEATQFAERIISIGCAAENGDIFSTYVKPPKGEKVNKFITKLTGITNKMLEDAPTADEAFRLLYDFVEECCKKNKTLPEYYCYGSSDIHFIKQTIHKMNDIFSITYATTLQHNLKDYHKIVQDCFDCSCCDHLSLKSIYLLCKEEDDIVWHNAMNDAKMLKYIDEHISEKVARKTISTITKPRIKKTHPTLPDYFVNEWGERGANAWNVDTFASSEDYKIKISKPNDDRVKYFNSWEVVNLWLIRFGFVTGVKATDKEKHAEIDERIVKNQNRKSYYGLRWEIKE